MGVKQYRMKYLGNISVEMDAVTKKYVDDKHTASAIVSALGNTAVNRATADADGNTISSTYLKRSGGTMTGALAFANNTWNSVGDDVQMGDHNLGGTLCIQGKNGDTGLAFYNYNTNTSNYTKLVATNSNANYTITMPSKTGTLVLTDGTGANGTWGISISGNAATASKVGTATVGSTNTPIYLNGGAPTSVSGINTALLQGVIPIHPEGESGILPYLTNDIAFLRARGGSCKIYWGTYSSATDYKADNVVDNMTLLYEGASTDSVFDASPAYLQPYPTGGCTPEKVLIVDIVMPSILSWSTKFYISFGSLNWGFKHINVFTKRVSSGYNDVYTSDFLVTNNSKISISTSIGAHKPKKEDGTTDSTPSFNRLRVLLTDSRNTSGSSSGTRIAQIGLVNFNSQGTRMTAMSRGIDDAVYRSITPASNNTYNLGSSSNKWANVYATTFVGALSGNASTASLLNNVSANCGTSASTWNNNKGGTIVWGQRFTFNAGKATYTPSGGTATNVTDSGDISLFLTSSTTSNTATLNMAIDGYVHAAGGFQGNASTATTLATSRSIWGQSFNGSTNVSGDMSSVGNISFSASGKNIGGIVYFDTTNSRVGIGVSSPTSRFHVYHSGSTLNTQSAATIVNDSNIKWLSVVHALAPSLGAKSNAISVIGKAASSKNAGYIGFNWSSNASNSNFLTLGLWGVDNVLNINGNGYVGIGTTEPTSKLDVNGSVNINGSLKIGDATISWDSTNGCLKVDKGLMSEEFVSAYGYNSSGSGGGSAASRLDTWASYNADKAEWHLSAFLGNDLNTRVSTLETKATSVSYTATQTSGTALGKLTIDGTEKTIYAPTISYPVTSVAGKKGAVTLSASDVGALASTHAASGVTSAKITNWDTAYGWGNHASAGYVTVSGAQTISGAKTFTAAVGITTNASITYNSTEKCLEISVS